MTGDGGVEFALWAPSFRDVAIERVRVRAEGVRGELLEARLSEDGAHWVCEGALTADAVFYEFEVDARLRSTGRAWTSRVSDPYARDVHRDFRSVVRRAPWPRPSGFVRPALRDLVQYELHVYNFTAEDLLVPARARGTYEGVQHRLAYLADLGVNALEFMPVFDYSDAWQVGVRWNYITACHLCAPHRGYAAREDDARAEFLSLVEAAHARGIAVLVDAVFNQVSRRFPYARIYDPDYHPKRKPSYANNPLLGDFGGTDPNPGSFPYRNKDWGGCDLDYEKPAALEFVSDVMEVWFKELGVDGMRFDHTLGFYRWKDLTVGAGAVAAAAERIGGSDAYRIAEHFSSEENELEMLVDTGFNSLWSKGFYHGVEDALNDRGLAHLEWRMNVRAQGFPDDEPPTVCLNNHDDERLPNRGGRPWWRLQPPTLALFLGPGIPMLYMGDEYGEDDRTRHANGLPREFNPLDWEQSEATGALLRLHRALGFLRRRLAVLRGPSFLPVYRHEAERVLVFARGEAHPEVLVALNFSDEAKTVTVPCPGPDAVWHEFLFNLTFRSRGGHLEYTAPDGAVFDKVLVPGAYAHIYCRDKAWTDAEWEALLSRDRY